MLLEKKRIIFQSCENGYVVIECSVIDNSNDSYCKNGDLITVSGYDLEIADHCQMNANGSWKDTKFGMQFFIKEYEEIIPKNYKAIFGFLNSGRIQGITPPVAELIYKQFRNETVCVLDDDAAKIFEITGISESIANKIRFSYEEERFYKKLLKKFKQYKFPESVLKRVFARYGKDTADMLNKDPYILCSYGVDVNSVDRITSSKSSVGRAKAIILLTLKEIENSNGNVCAPFDLFTSCVRKNAIKYRINDHILSDAEKSLIDNDELVYYDGFAYRKSFFEIENSIAKELKRINDAYHCPTTLDIDSEINNSEKILNCKLHIQQRKAVEYAIKSGVLVVTGGPGTGKTTVIKVIADIQERIFHRKLAFLAPTGRAASRMKESSGRQSSTIHRFLQLGVDTDFTEKSAVSIQEDCTFCDEVSMLDIFVAKSLFSSIQSGKQLVMFGDVNQLPSVGPGAVLKDMIDSGVIPTVYLTKVFRQSSNSNIYLNCQKIVKGNLSLEYGGDFILLDANTQEEAADLMADAFCDAVKENGLSNVCCLTPFRKKTETGSVSMNKRIQELLNPSRKDLPEIFHLPTKNMFRVGDRVMNMVNGLDFSNGDLGFITEIEHQSVTVKFEDGEKTFAYDELDQIRLAYAMTIHKSQGSEFKVVISTLLDSHGDMLQMNLFNTAVSRAKQKFILVGNENAINVAILNKGNINRYTGLRKKLQLLFGNRCA